MLSIEMFAEMTTLFMKPRFIQPRRAGGVAF
jgi:hypothetical protein